ncbi:ATP-dependent zinc protease [Candidatus Woesearchaeota archaeon]|nr:ATP-dependent zinc protease [Candidatus Woesearchaeota archaeon]
MKKRIILGLVEEVTLIGSNGKEKKVLARIDTGATSSSIDNSLAVSLGIGPSYKTKIIKSASGVKKRPIVKVPLKFNGDVLEEEFSLADREHMTYAVLIGQNILQKRYFLIDPNKEIKKYNLQKKYVIT